MKNKIKKKEDVKKIIEFLKGGEGRCLFYWFENFPYKGYTRIWFDPQEGRFLVFSKGSNWSDQAPTSFSEEEIEKIIWRERKFINNSIGIDKF